ncbi:response regulator transcription factor [Paenibacillus xylaniclasticus]|uniref:response regulator transcription factor n=1 Tax=Paenibacillus xylaniclasticus TaxID=588083 RepID=UPI000FD91060|nr:MULTISPECIES: response regulator [Paenibacillus]GFN33896.1 DNA-binding response regulator [Paenibacillus curdlanolyticus]
MKRTLLIVDDEPLTANGIRRMLEVWSAGSINILMANNGKEALEILDSQPVHLLISDIRMPELTGLNLVELLNKRGKDEKPAVILISGYAEFDYALQAIQLGVVNYLLKPISKEKLISAVEQALQLDEQRARIGIMQRMIDQKLLETNQTLSGSTLSGPVQEALRYVDEHLHLSFGLREVADHIHLHPSYLSARFKEQMHMTFSEYVVRRKLQKAKELLLQTNMPIAEISERLGYQTPRYFNKLFKEYEGCSPGQYRVETLK